MGYPIQQQVSPKYFKPFDERSQVTNAAARNALARKFPRMHVVTENDEMEWVLRPMPGGQTLTAWGTDDAHWEVAGAGTGEVTLAQLEAVRTSIQPSSPPSSSYTLQLADAGTMVLLEPPGTCRIPAGESVRFPLGTKIELMNNGPGQLTVVGDLGVALIAPTGSSTLAADGSSIRLFQRAPNEWVLTGGSGEVGSTEARPRLSELLPASGPVGTLVRLTGTNLTGVTAVRLTGVLVPGFLVESATSLTFPVPVGATAGQALVTVTAPGGTSNGLDFTVVFLALPQLAAPTNGQVVPTSTSSLTVTASTIAQAIGYKLYRSTGNAPFVQVGAPLAPTFVDTDLEADTTYFYQWQALGDGSTYTDSPRGAALSGATPPKAVQTTVYDDSDESFCTFTGEWTAYIGPWHGEGASNDRIHVSGLVFAEENPLPTFTTGVLSVAGTPEEGIQVYGFGESSITKLYLQPLPSPTAANEAWYELAAFGNAGLGFAFQPGGDPLDPNSYHISNAPHTYYAQVKSVVMVSFWGLPRGHYRLRLVKQVNAVAGDTDASTKYSGVDGVRVHTRIY